MSSVSEKEHRIIDDFDYGDNVSIIDRSEIVDWSAIVIKIILGLVFIGFASGCIIYSVITSEEYVHPAAINSTFFSYDVSQHCDNGTLTWSNRTGSINDYDKVTTGIAWLQDSTRKRIYHRIGIAPNDKDWRVSHYVFVNHTFFVDRNGCTRQAYGYDEYLRRLGFHKIRMQRTESISVEEDESVKVNFYEGEPSHDIMIDGTRMQSVLNLGKTTVTTCTFLRAASTSLQGKGPLKTNWKENVVYLYQFPRPANRQPNLSPYCLKIETFLRANRIKHEVVGTWLTLRQSPRGLLPFIELNGQQISDSQVIVWKLQKHFDLDDKLEGSDRGTARAVERMIDLSTNYALLVDKTVNNAHLLLARQVSNLPLPSFLTNYLAKGFSQTARKRVNGVLGKLDVAEQKELLRRDIRAIDDILGDKKFLFGDRITSVDCSVFGQIGAVFYLPYRQQISDLLEDDFPRVRAYCDRIRQHYYPEWRDD